MRKGQDYSRCRVSSSDPVKIFVAREDEGVALAGSYFGGLEEGNSLVVEAGLEGFWWGWVEREF